MSSYMILVIFYSPENCRDGLSVLPRIFVSCLYKVAPEQKARSTYDNILRVVRDIPEIADPIKFLRAREIVHYQRFGEALRSVQEQLDAKNFYAFNPSFDNPCKASCQDSR